MRGERLFELRTKFGYTREELAESLYVTPSIIQSWEQGWAIINPSSGEIDEMAEVFEMTEEELREYLEQDEEDDYDNENSKKMLDDCIEKSKKVVRNKNKFIRDIVKGKLF